MKNITVSVPDDVYRDHVGIHAEKGAGLLYVGAAVLRGRLTAEQILRVAELAEWLGGGEVRTTNMQNLLLPHVRNEYVPRLTEELARIGLPLAGSSFWRGAVACSGTEFCKLALTETKSFTRWLVEELEVRVPEFDETLKLHVTGCPNSCGQHWIADIGIEGKKVKAGGRMVDAYYFCLGGAVGAHAGVARPVGYRCAADEVPDAIERLLRTYLNERDAGDNLRKFFARRSNDELRSILAGAPVMAVERDPAGRGAAPSEF